jgi:hypothetical protein
VSESSEPTAEELVAELRKANVGDFLIHTCSLIASLGYGKLAPETRDLEQARLAIDALTALRPLVSDDAARQVDDVLAGLKLAYVDAAKES